MKSPQLVGGRYAPRSYGFHLNASNRTGHLASITPDAILRIGSDRPLFPRIPAKDINKTSVYTRLTAGTCVLINLNLHAVHRPLIFSIPFSPPPSQEIPDRQSGPRPAVYSSPSTPKKQALWLLKRIPSVRCPIGVSQRIHLVKLFLGKTSFLLDKKSYFLYSHTTIRLLV